MKKLLLASTALVMTAGVAAADVSLSGDGRMGFVYDGDDVRMTSRARVTFTLSGETSTGLTFGGSFRADNAGDAAGNTEMTGGSVFISGEFGRLSMGDVEGAARAAVGDLYGVGLTGLGDLNEMTYLDRIGNDLDGFYETLVALEGEDITFDFGLSARTRALYEFSFDGFTGYLSVGQLSRSDEATTTDNSVSPPDVSTQSVDLRLRELAIGASYTFDGFTGAVGYEDTRLTGDGGPVSFRHLTGSAEYEFDGFRGKVFAGRAGGDLGTALSEEFDGTSRLQYGASVEGTFDETTVTAFASRTFFRETNYGVGASYDMGGGASVVGGVVRQGGSTALGTSSNTVADFGVSFSF